MIRRRKLAIGARLLAIIAAVLVLAPSATAGATPGPPDAPEWWFDTWKVPTLWQQGADGQGVTIAEIDSGVNAQVPQLSANVLPGTDLGSQGGDGRTDREVDTFGHGTAMASIMVAQRGPYSIEGLAPGAKILPIAIPLEGTTDEQDDDHLPDAIMYAADHGAKIISMSLGGERDPVVDPEPCPADEQAAVTYAVSKGLILVAAGGNSGPTDNPVEEPGVCLGVVSVGAVDSSETVASFSSRHPYLTVSAPGVKIPSLGRIPGQAFSGDGTSQATAMTSASLAMIWSKFPTLTNSQVVARLLATLDKKSATRDPSYGYGVINPYRAITTDVPATADDPVFDALAPYEALNKAQVATAPSAPTPPITTAPQPPGHYAVGTQPGRFTTNVILAGALALLGLLALLLLVGAGRRGHRRRTALGATSGIGLGFGGGIAVRAPGAPPDSAWRELVAPPPEWAPPTAPPDWSAFAGDHVDPRWSAPPVGWVPGPAFAAPPPPLDPPRPDGPVDGSTPLA